MSTTTGQALTIQTAPGVTLHVDHEAPDFHVDWNQKIGRWDAVRKTLDMAKSHFGLVLFEDDPDTTEIVSEYEVRMYLYEINPTDPATEE